MKAARRFAHANSVPRIARPRNTTSHPGPGSGTSSEAADRDHAAEHADADAVGASQTRPRSMPPTDAAEHPPDRPIGSLALGDLLLELRSVTMRTRYIAKLEVRRAPAGPILRSGGSTVAPPPLRRTGSLSSHHRTLEDPCRPVVAPHSSPSDRRSPRSPSWARRPSPSPRRPVVHSQGPTAPATRTSRSRATAAPMSLHYDLDLDYTPPRRRRPRRSRAVSTASPRSTSSPTAGPRPLQPRPARPHRVGGDRGRQAA